MTSRLTLLFFSAYVIVTSLHELSHAVTGYLLGFPSTLHHFYVDIDWSELTVEQRALVGVVGPLFSLVFGFACWVLYRHARGAARELPLLLLAAFGVGTFFGNLLSTSFVGDFSAAARASGLPMIVRHGLSAAGAIGFSATLFVAGKELARWAPAHGSRLAATVRLVAVPVTVGTALLALAYQPMPAKFVIGLAGASLFWVFAGIAVFLHARRPGEESPEVTAHWSDVAVALAAVIVLRVMARGLPF